VEVALVHPEIPQNTGNIARTCAAVGASLHLVHPLGFSVSERAVRRAGLDYWHLVPIIEHPDLESFLSSTDVSRMCFFTSKSENSLPNATFSENPILVFGSETRGLPAYLTELYRAQCVRIPTVSQARCLNLSNAAAIGVYEALRRNGYEGQELSRPAD